MQLPVPDLPDLDRMALIVVDVQQGFEGAGYWGPRNNPLCEANIGGCCSPSGEYSPGRWCSYGTDSAKPGSPLRPGQPGNDFKDIITGRPDLLIRKQVNSHLHGIPDLVAWLPDRSIDGLVLPGITTNHCCETTARVGGNLVHGVLFALDASHTFDRPWPDGQIVSARRAVSGHRHEPARRVRHRGEHQASPGTGPCIGNFDG